MFKSLFTVECGSNYMFNDVTKDKFTIVICQLEFAVAIFFFSLLDTMTSAGYFIVVLNTFKWIISHKKILIKNNDKKFVNIVNRLLCTFNGFIDDEIRVLMILSSFYKGMR